MFAALGFGLAYAYDVESENIRYNILDGLALEVTSMLPVEFPGEIPDERYSGDIVIPSDVYVEGHGRLPVVSIGDFAFSHCDVRSVILPPTIIQMGDYAFYCSSLQTINLSETGLSKISNYAFDGCERLESVTLPESLKEIGAFSFSLTSLKTLTLPDSIERIDAFAFDSTPIERLVMNNSLWLIGERAFSSTLLKKVSWSESMSIISWGAFEHSTLTEVILPATITNICGMAFGEIDGLSRVVCMAVNPSDIAIHAWAFLYTDLSKCTLEVPAESLTLYENAPVWCEFGHIVPYDDASIAQPEISVETCVKVCDGGLELLAGRTDVVIYDTHGRMVYYNSHSQAAESHIMVPLPTGIYIVKNGYSTAKFCVN